MSIEISPHLLAAIPSNRAHHCATFRDARVLEYLNFRSFQPVVEKAKEACARSGHAVTDHFAEVRNMVGISSGAQRELEDWALSRYACYLVIQNADPSKPLVALGQSYFAVQTRRQELADDDEALPPCAPAVSPQPQVIPRDDPHC
jgi:hypothetical protein